MDPIPDWFVVEISSFQLADIRDFRSDVGVVTNLAPDHLDRYPTLASYYADKARLFENATGESVWVLNGDSADVEALAGDAPGNRYRFSVAGSDDSDALLKDGVLCFSEDDGEVTTILSEAGLPILGLHNVANALAACLAARAAGVEASAMGAALRSFPPLPHRLEVVGETGGVRWVNDSKATNVAATVGALGSLDGPLVLLLGGKDKGEDLTALKEAIHGGVRGAVVYGEARERLALALEGVTRIQVVDGSFAEAVETGLSLAAEGDDLLLSPACSSFDMFESYVERGRRFAELAGGRR
jgi:UDP-N-acetylmuramoylalanine--D-glutamate ligase